MNTQGKIIVINEIEVISEKFKKRSFVLEHGDNPQYLENVLFELHQDRCSILDNFKVGDMVDVSFNLKGRKWTNENGIVKYLNTLNAWKIDPANGTHDNGQEQNESIEGNNEGDDLPF